MENTQKKKIRTEAEDASSEHKITTEIRYGDIDNKHLSLMVHKSGNGTIWCHRAKNVSESTMILDTGTIVHTYKVEQIDGRYIQFKVFFDKED